MRIKLNANQITALRIVLLPLPLFLIYGDTKDRMIALVIFTLLGLTDYIDGVMARRFGVTRLGKLLDPIADKIFMAVTLVPLVHLKILPLWIVWPIFFREFLVTEMRRFMTPGKKGLRVTELAKVKTTVQMIGVGLILLTDTFPDKLITISFLSGLLLATVALAITLSSKGQPLSQRFKVALGLESMALVIVCIFSAKVTVLIYGLVILGITLLSGADYFRACLPAVIKAFPSSGLHLVSSLLLPMLALLLVPWAPGKAHFIVVLILAVEFAVQGIDTWAVQEKRPDLSNIKKKIFIPLILGTSLVLVLFGFPRESVLWYFFLFYGIVTTGYLVFDVWFHRELFLSGEFF